METKKITMDLQGLQKIGAFVSKVPVPIDFEWADGVVTTYVRRLSGCQLIDLLSVNADEDRSVTARILSAAICLDPEGKTQLSFVHAYQLVEPLMTKLMDAVTKVNGGRKDG